jgi:hypothetical protein
VPSIKPVGVTVFSCLYLLIIFSPFSGMPKGALLYGVFRFQAQRYFRVFHAAARSNLLVWQKIFLFPSLFYPGERIYLPKP